MSRSNVTATEPRCAVCQDTGSKSQRLDGDLDCNHCDATDKRLALRKHLAQFTAYPDQDVAAWAAYLFAQHQAVADGVLRDGVEQEPIGLFLRITDAYSETWLHQRGEVDDDAVALYAAPVGSQPSTPKLPATPEEAIAFIGPHFDGLGMEGPIMDRRITLSVHDLLSAFRDHVDFPTEVAAQPVGAVPGWQLVPKQPTPEMVNTLAEGNYSISITDAYSEMLKVAPVAVSAAPSGELVAEVVDNGGKLFCMLMDWDLLSVGTRVYLGATPSGEVEREIAFLENWLSTIAEPIGSQCCGQGVVGAEYMGQQETVCCGSPEPDFMSLNDLTEAMNKRRDDLIAAITATKE